MTLITGNTFPVKESLKALGGSWDKVNRGWIVPDDKAEEARAIVAKAPKSAPRGNASRFRSRNRYVSNHFRFSGGGEAYQNKRGRCIDAPCCGCCS